MRDFIAPKTYAANFIHLQVIDLRGLGSRG